MIIQNNESKISSLAELLGVSTKNTSSKDRDVFSKLLASLGAVTKEETAKNSPFTALIDPKKSPTKLTDSATSRIHELQALLGSEPADEDFISKEMLSTLSNDQVRTLIQKAKEFLKNEIISKAPEHQIDTKTLPKTLSGLIQLADKMGLEPKAITLSTLISDNDTLKDFSSEILSKPLLETKALALISPKIADESDPLSAITQLLSEIKNKENKSNKSGTDITVDKKGESSAEQPLKTLLQTLDKREVAPITSTETATVQEIKPTTAASISTKTESLLTLLQGDEAKEIKKEGSAITKTEGESSKSIQNLKADSIEVKSKEAQQSMRYFATDLKEAVENYKPPFTRLNMTLNPEKLGEVEVTLVQRGNNVHVNIQSNNTNSIAFLAHNATELKAQLASQGITNATMNFMSGGDQQNQNSQDQQQQNRYRPYTSFEELELNEEQLSALEIIIPHYA